MRNQYISPSKGRLTQSELISEIESFVNDEPNVFYRLIIGTDSLLKRKNGQMECDFVTAVIIHRSGKGARYFWQKENKVKNYVLRDKIYTETMKSLETAQKLVPELRQVMQDKKYELEIHIDVGAIGPTREMLKEVVGMVNGNGFTAKTKPQSWGASNVADKHT